MNDAGEETSDLDEMLVEHGERGQSSEFDQAADAGQTIAGAESLVMASSAPA